MPAFIDIGSESLEENDFSRDLLKAQAIHMMIARESKQEAHVPNCSPEKLVQLKKTYITLVTEVFTFFSNMVKPH